MSEPMQRATAARRLGDIAQLGDTVVGVAVSAAGSATVRGGGLAAVAEPRGSAAVGVIDLEQRGERWWGRLARGVAAAQSAVEVTIAKSSNGQSAAPGVYGETVLTNPFAVPARLTVRGRVDDWLIIDGVAEPPQNPRDFVLERELPIGGQLRLAVQNRSPVPYNPWSLTAVATFLPIDLDWRPAARALVPVATGLGWWGAIEAAARSGQWVRRASWVSGRRVRFEAGLGTTRAVARHEVSGAVSTVDASSFGMSEFMGEDWTIEDDAVPVLDVTDVVFEGPLVFAVAASENDPSGGGGTGDQGGTFPQSGEGVPYVRGGRVVSLLPIKDGSGAIWRP